MQGEGSRERKWDRMVGMLMMGMVPVLVSSCAEVGVAPPMQESSLEAREAFEPTGDMASSRPLGGGAALAGSPEMVRRAVPQRPGLGTTWGEMVDSPMTYTGFVRAGSKPAHGLATIWYNDREGIDAMTGRDYHPTTGRNRAAGGLVEWGIKSGLSTLRTYHWKGRDFVAGRKGARYSIVVKSHARSRLEVVLSVDGLDVVDGKEATTRKRGYILWPGRTLEVKGWRWSEGQVASFRFSRVADSYTSLKGNDTRNVGVIGMAVFTEKGVDPWNGYAAESNRRFAASPFADAPVQRAR